MADKKHNRIRKDSVMIAFDVIKYILLTITSLLCVLPFVLIVSGSITSNETILREGYSILPRDISFDAYSMIFKAPKDILQAYKITIYYTAVGTLTGLAVIVLTAYVISRKEFKYRNVVSFLIYFTSIFGGGLVAWYLMYTNILGLKGTTFAIWFPAIMSPFLVILMRTFITGSVPDAIVESAKIDGAGHGTILTRIVLPVLGPGLATVGLFLALGYWNDWFQSSLYISEKKLTSLQALLNNMIQNIQYIASNPTAGLSLQQYKNSMPTESIRMAIAVLVVIPIACVYPFFQRYFISGLTVGAVKG